MNMRSSTQTKAESSFTPVQTGLLQRKCASCGQHTITGGECAECQKKRMPLQRRAANQAEPSEVPPIVHEVLRSPGQPLDAATRAFMEPRFGHDFSRVRVHTDTKAAESAQAVNAQAYTLGQNVVFGAGQYAPDTNAGRTLLAHELTHTIQQVQHSDIPPSFAIGRQNSTAEREADQVASTVNVGGAAHSITSLGNTPEIQRACGPREVGMLTGCVEASSSPTGERFVFEVNCDTLRDEELRRLVDFSRTISNRDTIRIHGFASEEGSIDFNDNLSCLRAQTAQNILQYALSLQGISAQFNLIKHGATVGRNRAEYRSVIIDKTSASPPQTQETGQMDGSNPPPAPTPAPAPVPLPTAYKHNTELGGLSVGNFNFRFRNCAILIWVWVKFQFESDISAAEQASFKRRFFDAIHSVWENSGYHLTGSNSCPCHTIPIRIHAQESSTGFYHKLVDVERAYRRPNVISDINVSLETSDQHIAHEFGHVLGLYDEYDGGWIENHMFWHRNRLDDPNALMNTGTELRERYFERYRNRVQQTATGNCQYRVSSPMPPVP